MTSEGTVVKLAEGLYYSAEAYRKALDMVVVLIRQKGQVTVAQVRDELQTSRKYALGLLEHLDAQRITRRQGDTRVLGRQAPSCA
jgi:selenocysteine-specific elongation factor